MTTDTHSIVSDALLEGEAPDLPLFSLLSEYGQYYPVRSDKSPLRKASLAATPKLLLQSRLKAFEAHPDRTGWAVLITSPHLLIVDCESPGKKGGASLGADGVYHFNSFWQSYLDDLPKTLTIESGSGGRHFYFRLAVDAVPAGQHLQTRTSALPGVDLITYGNRILLPGSQVTVQNGPGRYSVIGGPDAGIVEMPRPLALAFADLLGFKGLKSSQSRTNRNKRSKLNNAGACSGACGDEPRSIADDRVEPIVAGMLQRFSHMPKLWAFDVAAKSGDQSVSGFEYNIAVAAAIYGCDSQTAEAVVRHWHDLRQAREDMRPFDSKKWDAVWKGAAKRAERDKKEEEEKEVVTKVNYPHTEIHPDFLPIEPSPEKQEAFHAIPKAVRTFNRERSDLDKCHTDCPEEGEWMLTACYLLGIAFQARSLGCSKGETVWYWLGHCQRYALDFPLTQRRMETLMLMVDGRVRAIRTQRKNRKASVEAGLVEPKKRKPRSDRGSSKRLRQVARARERGKSLGQIAKELDLAKSTVQGYVAEINARGGADAVLRPKRRSGVNTAPSSDDAALLIDVCRANDYHVEVRTANSLSRKLRDYMDQTGFHFELTARMVEKALQDPINRNSRNLLRVLQLFLANATCEQDTWIKALALRIRQAGLPIALGSNGSTEFVVSQMDLPAAVRRACCIRRELRSFVGAADFDFHPEDICKKAAELGSMRWAIEFAGRECASAWIARGDAECEGELLAS